MEHCKLQIGCLVSVLYIAFIYLRECKRNGRSLKDSLFDELLVVGIVCIIFDGLTAYTVNHLESVNEILNRILHMCYLLSIDTVVFSLFVYMLNSAETLPKTMRMKVLTYGPFVVNVIVVVANIGSLDYHIGKNTNYSMGISAYTCYTTVAIYVLLTMIVFFRKWPYIADHKRTSIFTYLMVLFVVTTIQMLVPEALISSIAPTILIIGVYMNMEDPARRELAHFHKEMVMGFATLIESKDDSTGGHVRRTTLYAKALAKELRDRKYYRDVLSKDYVKNIVKAAPMHDIGKISIPDAVLQKPGKLTEEEFAVMKQHAENGGKIIQDTFGHLSNQEYRDVAYQVARHHHERWNGKGYPEGLREEEIPLCARIMAVADVFDAISQNRCYRAAMPLDPCFEIIKEGRGKDFDPVIVDVFLDIREQVEEIHRTEIAALKERRKNARLF